MQPDLKIRNEEVGRAVHLRLVWSSSLVSVTRHCRERVKLKRGFDGKTVCDATSK